MVVLGACVAGGFAVFVLGVVVIIAVFDVMFAWVVDWFVPFVLLSIVCVLGLTGCGVCW